MTTFELLGYGTDSRYAPDVRHREYTTSEAKAKLFEQIPRIQWTDSGHGIVFTAKPHSGKRQPVLRLEYVDEQLALLKAPRPLRRLIERREEERQDQVDHLKKRIDALEGAAREAIGHAGIEPTDSTVLEMVRALRAVLA